MKISKGGRGRGVASTSSDAEVDRPFGVDTTHARCITIAKAIAAPCSGSWAIGFAVAHGANSRA